MTGNTIIRTGSSNEDFTGLIQLLNDDLYRRYGSVQAFYDQFNQVDQIRNVVILYVGGRPVACGAFKMYDKDCVEIKRMFVLAEFRGKGYASEVLSELERWARELGYSSFILETGRFQPEAIRLYQKFGYKNIPNYGQYVGMKESVCLKKNG